MNLLVRCIPCTSSPNSSRFFASLLLLTSLLVPAAVKAQAPQEDSGQFQLQSRTRPSLLGPDAGPPTRRIHGVRFKVNRLGGENTAAAGGLNISNVTPTCNHPALSYFQGPVISNVQPVAVFWTNHVNSQLTANGTGIAQFLGDVGSSPYFGVLSQYSTYGSAITNGTDQWIGNGSSSVPSYTIIPLTTSCTGAAACTLTDAQIQTELNAQITAGSLPAPTYDSQGNANTIYMTYMPPKITVNDGGSYSCQDFCAYHNTGYVGSSSNPLVYGVLMDEFTTACANGCGQEAAAMDNMTETSSHELAEAITDADVGLDTAFDYAYPAGWGDNNNNCGEIGDICDSGVGDTITVSGRTWHVQQIWSNKDNQCESTTATVFPPYVLSLPGTVNAGSPFNLTLTVQNPTGGTYTGYTGTVHFTSSDSSAVLPADYTYSAGDAGVHTFQATLNTGTSQTITATDATHTTLTATNSVSITQPAPAVLTTPTPGSILAGTTIKFTWTPGTGVSGYSLHLSAVAPGNYDLYASGHITTTNRTVSGLPLTGGMIYARLYSVINGTTVYNDYTYTAASLARLTSPAPTSIFTSNVVQFTWSPGGGVTDYDLHLSAVAPGDADLYSSGQNTGTTTVVSKLPTNGGPIYARLYSIINGVTYYNDYTYTALSIAKLTSPVSGSTLTSTDLAFKWSAANVSAQYDLHLSTVAAGDADLYSSGHVAGTAAVAKVPGNGETVFARLYTIIGGGTYYNDFTYTAK